MMSLRSVAVHVLPLLIIFSALFGVFMFTQEAQAQGTNTTITGFDRAKSGPGGGIRNPLGDVTLMSFLGRLLDLLIKVATPFIILMIIYAGFLFVMAQGNPGEIERARSVIVWTLVGAMLILGARALLALVQGTIDAIK